MGTESRNQGPGAVGKGTFGTQICTSPGGARVLPKQAAVNLTNIYKSDRQRTAPFLLFKSERL